jgi:virulence-associated protein VapD
MEPFNIQKYLTENNLTIISKIREDVEDSENQEPTKDDLKSAEKDFRDLDKKKKEYADLQSKVKAIIAQYSVRNPDGTLKLKDVAAYKIAVGNIPDRLKLLKQQIDSVEQLKIDDNEKDSD